MKKQLVMWMRLWRELIDVIVLARGSPGVGQKKMTEKANAFGKPIVTAIQILDGQTTTDNDLSNAVLDCTTNCVMLLEEAHPDIILEIISSLCKELESSIDYKASTTKNKESSS
ncbi:Pyruvate kinase family protein [Raphanus sativus]|nr:Pyruvate kinase family protein [Raphanus sativus]